MRPFPDRKVATGLKWFLSFWAALLILRLGELQILKHDVFSKMKLRQVRVLKTIEPRRGTIYDREGRILAISVPAWSAYARRALSDQEFEKLRKVLGLSRSQIKVMKKRWEKGNRFTWIKRKILEEEKRKIQALGIDKIGFLPDFRRVYPHKHVASHIVGAVGVDGKGLWGIELSREGFLGGRPGKMEILRDAKGYPLDITVKKAPVPGRDLHLTLDLSIQRAAERALFQGAKAVKAPRAAAIVMNLQGEVLAMASYPSFDPNQFSREFAHHPERIRNNAISMVYEPGSTVKFVDMAAALQEGKVKLGERIDCGGGKIRIGKTIIRDHRPYYILSLSDVLVHSSNVGAIRITQRLSNEKFYNYLKAFHLGEKTGIELPGEEKGWVPQPRLWHPTTKAYFSIGQGFAVTPIQMAAAVGVIADGGVWRKPHLIPGDFPGHRVISKEVSSTVLRMMRGVVERGTGRLASLSWIGAAGKTGTAEKITPKGRKYTSSFVGAFPYPAPEYVIAVVVDEPKGKHYGGEVAAPIFREITLFLAEKNKLYPVVMK